MKIYFAPLQGYTDAPYRNLHNQIFGGIEEYYSPFIRLEKGEVRNRDIRDISPVNNTIHSLVPQIIVSDSDEFCTLSDVVESFGYNRIDINLGCSFSLQTKKGRGAALIVQEKTVEQIMLQVAKRHNIDFSVKMRLGVNSDDDFKSILPILNDTPLSHITIHPRIAAQQYKGSVNIDMFNQFYSLSKHPIIYNGDILSVEDIQTIETTYPEIKGVMIGRGLLTRPSLAFEYNSKISMNSDELLDKIVEMHSRLFEHYSNSLQGETQILMKLKTFWEYLEPNIERKTAKLIKKAVNLVKYNNAVSTIRY